MFPAELESTTFRSRNGEFGWTRARIPAVLDALRAQAMGVLGGELWWVPDGAKDWSLVPQRYGPPAVYPWVTKSEVWGSLARLCRAQC